MDITSVIRNCQNLMICLKLLQNTPEEKHPETPFGDGSPDESGEPSPNGVSGCFVPYH